MLIKTSDDSDIATHAQTIEQTATELLSLSEKARKLQKIVHIDGQQQPSEFIALIDLIDSVPEEVVQIYPDIDLTVDDSLPEEIPAPAYLDIALTELFENAFKHSDRQTPTLAISPITDDTNRRVELSVADTGPGIPEQERAALRNGEETPLQRGSGLGLWLVHWIVTTAGGTVTITDNDPHGSLVTLDFLIPRDEQDKLDDTPASKHDIEYQRRNND